MLMPKKIGIVVIFILVILTACGKYQQPASQVQDNQGEVNKTRDPIVDFQKDVIPVIENAMNKYFQNDTQKFFDQADYYFDNTVNNLKVVFLVDQINTDDFAGFQKELEEKLDNKVMFKKSEINPRILSETKEKVAQYIDKLHLGKEGYNVGYNTKDQVVEVRAKLSDEQIRLLKQKFEPVVLRIRTEFPESIQ